MACACVNKFVDCGTAPNSNSRQETAIAQAVNPLAEVKDFIRRHGDDQTAPEWLQQLTAETSETSFENVIITIRAATPREAYDKLCGALGAIDDAEFTTDTFCINGGESHCTSELWPKDTETIVSTPADQ